MNLLNIKNPSCAYILGLLWADGCVRKTDNGTILKMINTDFIEIKPILDKVANWKYTTIQPKNSPNLQGIANLYNKELKTFLIGLDYNNKSLVSPDKVLGYLPKELHPYWLRGFFDGDGSIHVNGCEFTGSYYQDWSAIIKILNYLNVDYVYKQNIRKLGKSSTIKIGRYDTISLMDYIYQGEIFGLLRKYNKYLDFKKARNTPRKKFSNYIGVYKGKQKGKFRSQIMIDNKLFNLGYFNSEIEAALAYDDFAKTNAVSLGKRFKLNFSS